MKRIAWAILVTAAGLAVAAPSTPLAGTARGMEVYFIDVEGGAATLTGDAATAGLKGNATRMAKSCRATSVTNNITAPPVPKPKKAEKKEEKKG